MVTNQASRKKGKITVINLLSAGCNHVAPEIRDAFASFATDCSGQRSAHLGIPQPKSTVNPNTELTRQIPVQLSQLS